jgi:hypothetical protein
MYEREIQKKVNKIPAWQRQNLHSEKSSRHTLQVTSICGLLEARTINFANEFSAFSSSSSLRGYQKEEQILREPGTSK